MRLVKNRHAERRLIQPTMARDRMRYWRLTPDARLAPWILCYWYVEPDPHTVSPDADALDRHQLLIPDGHSEIVFRLEGGFTRWRLDAPEQRAQMRASYVIGGRSHSVLTHTTGGLRLAGVKLDPRALRALLKMPLTEFRDSTVACADLECATLMDLEDEVANLASVDQMAKVFDRYFMRRMPDGVEDEPSVAQLLERIRVTHGAQSIMDWASDHAVDPRTLERRFVARMGMTPKQYARIARFKNAYRWLGSQRPGERCSYLESYYDESHFNREFRHFLGMSPTKLLSQAAHFRTTVADHLLAAESS
jgi:AraC-like DNA-binding protein